MLRVLVAEDHEVTRRGIEGILRDAFQQVEITEAADVTALTAELGKSWDLILLDIFMPGGTILDVLGRIRSADAHVPVLVLTSATELEYVLQVMRAGANGLVHKHLAADELVTAIRKVSEGGSYLHSETAAEIAKTLTDVGVAEQAGPLPHERLSERELDVFKRLAQGQAIKQIAGDLRISDKTVATYLTRIRDKTNLSSHVDITRYALQNGIVT